MQTRFVNPFKREADEIDEAIVDRLYKLLPEKEVVALIALNNATLKRGIEKARVPTSKALINVSRATWIKVMSSLARKGLVYKTYEQEHGDGSGRPITVFSLMSDSIRRFGINTKNKTKSAYPGNVDELSRQKRKTKAKKAAATRAANRAAKLADKPKRGE